MSNLHEIELPGVSQVTQTLIFQTLWTRLPNKSFISGLWLRNFYKTPLWPNCFLYVLPVDKYRYFRHYFGNIILVTPGERGLLLQGSAEDRIQYALDIEEKSKGRSTANWEAVKELETELKKLYNKSFPVTWGGIVGYSYSLEDQKRIVGALNKDFWDSFK